MSNATAPALSLSHAKRNRSDSKLSVVLLHSIVHKNVYWGFEAWQAANSSRISAFQPTSRAALVSASKHSAKPSRATSWWPVASYCRRAAPGAAAPSISLGNP